MPATPQSPPKRMTRARTKAVEEKQANFKPAKTATPAARTVSNKRKTRAEDESELVESTRIRKNSSAVQSTMSSSAKSQPKKESTAETMRSIQRNTTSSNQPAKTRTGPATKAAATSTAKPTTGTQATETAARMTRARSGSVNTALTAAGPRQSKKKVTFQEPDEANKENITTEARITAKKPASKAQGGPRAGLGPSAASTHAPTKAGKTTTSKTGMNQTQNNLPLSPKKDTQIAKAPQSQDNLVAEEATKHLQKSPTKALTPASVAEKKHFKFDRDESDGIHNKEQSMLDDSSTPSKTQKTTLMTSPARRPPPSPFKDALKGTPRRQFMEKAGFTSLQSQDLDEEPLMSKSPIKLSLPDFPSQSGVEITGQAAASLLKSPAKRPPSPLKMFSPAKATERRNETNDIFGPTIAAGISGSPRKPGNSPIKSSKVLKTAVQATPKEQTSPRKNAAITCATTEEGTDGLSSPRSVPRVESGLLASPFATKAAVDSEKNSGPLEGKHDDVSLFPMEVDEAQDHAVANGDATLSKSNLFSVSSRAVDLLSGDDSEDELHSSDIRYQMSPSPERKGSAKASYTPLRSDQDSNRRARSSLGMTALAERFGDWKGATPDLKVTQQRKTEHSLFSPVKQTATTPLKTSPQSSTQTPDVTSLQHCHFTPAERSSPMVLTTNTEIPQDESLAPEPSSPIQPSYFEEAMAIREDSDIEMRDTVLENEPSLSREGDYEQLFRQSQISDASQDYGDENAVPVDPALLEPASVPTATCTPARVFSQQPKVVHTVSKVPLKPSADFEPSLVVKKARRTHSLSRGLSPRGEFDLHALRQMHRPEAGTDQAVKPHTLNDRDGPLPSDTLPASIETPRKESNTETATPTPRRVTWSVTATPARTPRAGLDPKLLTGAVVLVDVHTSEGADASGLFCELLAQMGAKCVKAWNWNPRASVSSVSSDLDSSDASDFANGKVGITHVVFKDGGIRTMEKVRAAKGLVLCVGVSWVLDCERENKWLDEADYAIDVSTIPRGGHRRRKSMEPKMLSRGATNVFDAPTQSNISPTKEFLQLSSPADRRQTIAGPEQDRRVSFAPVPEVSKPSTPATPKASETAMEEDMTITPGGGLHLESNFGSPTTPYFVHTQKLEQHTCPPKQTQELLFPVSGRITDQPNQTIRERLLQARRKSLQWAPRVGSPLSKPDA